MFIHINKNCLIKTKKILKNHDFAFKNPIIITDKTILSLAAKKIIQQYKKHTLYLIKTNTFQKIEKIIKKAQKNKNDLVINIGGGRIIDTGQYSATKLKIPAINIPTAPSHDGIASKIAIIKNKKGITESLGVDEPIGIIADLNILKKAPKQMIAAGTADLLSNFSSLKDWQLANKDKKEKINKKAFDLARQGANLIYTEYKNKKKINCRTEKFIKLLVQGLIMGSQSMSIAGTSRPCSGAEHEIAHAIEALYPNKFSHGEEVALGTIIANKIRNKQDLSLSKIFVQLYLPITYQDLGLTKSQIIKAIQLAPKTRPGRYTILEKKKLNRKQTEKIINI